MAILWWFLVDSVTREERAFNRKLMDAFKGIYWNVHQLHAWVYTGDRQLVGEVADDAPKGEFYQEVTLPDGQRKLIKTETNLRDPMYITMHAKSNGTARLTWTAAEDEILIELCAGRLAALGVENKEGVLKPIESYQWADLKFYYDPDFAGPKDLLRRGATTWRELKFKREQILEVWPDPLDSVHLYSATEPPEPLSDDDLVGWLRHDVWTYMQAVFILYGKAPRGAVSASDEIGTHFMQAKIYLDPAMAAGVVGRKIQMGGEDVWVDSPKHWFRWADGKDLTLDDRVVKHFDEDRPSVASILEEEADYQEFESHKSSMRLHDQICYAMNIHPGQRDRWTGEQCRAYERVLHKAQGAIAGQQLVVTTVDGHFFIDKLAFSEWIRGEDEDLAVEYERSMKRLEAVDDDELQTEDGLRPAEYLIANSDVGLKDELDEKQNEQPPTFDPVPLATIANMFRLSSNEQENIAQWRKIAGNAARNGLVEKNARIKVGRGRAESTFNPEIVGVWLVLNKGFTQNRVNQILKNNLPERSEDRFPFYGPEDS